jgi:amino acid transporter
MSKSVVSGLRGQLTAPKIVLLVVAAAAPLAAVVGTVPLSFALGNGVGVPGMFLLAGVVLLCFSVGYAAMSRRIVNAGGFYTYLARGLGRPAAVAGGLVAVISYNAVSIGLVGAFGYFANLVASDSGIHLPWEVWSLAAIVAVGALGYRRIDLSARVLSVLMVAEIAVLAILDVGVVAHKGAAALPVASVEPAHLFTGAVGVTMMFAFMSFIGFESAALYGEESRDPRRSVPLATYSSVVVIAVFYALTSWVAVGAVGQDQLAAVAGTQLGNLFFTLATTYVGQLLTSVMQILLCTSLFAAALALHNASNRYMFVLGRDGVLPAALGGAHPRHHSPHRASIVQTILTVLVVGAFAAAGLDPYTNLATSVLGLGTLGIVLLQAAAAVSVLGFFRARADNHWWRTGLAPLIGAVGLAASAVLLVDNFPTLTGTANPVVNALPWLLVAAAVVGVGFALWLRAARPATYARLAADQPAEPDRPERPDEPEQPDQSERPAAPVPDPSTGVLS